MTTSQTLDDLMEQSVQDSRREPEFFRALLTAMLYSHAPLESPSERLHLVMFKSPDDGALVVPVFTDEAKAEFAAQGSVRVVSMPGRTLFDISRGATVMINPNDVRCTLYPEEISELLATGIVAYVRKNEVLEGKAQYFKLDKVPTVLAKAMKKELPNIRGVELAYVVGLKWQEAEHPDSLLIVLGGRPDREDREVRALATALHRTFQELDKAVDVIHFDGRQGRPEWIRHLGLTPVYRRRLGQPGQTHRYN